MRVNIELRLNPRPRHRTDNLSAATHELVRSRGRGFNARYRDFLAHYHMEPTANNPGKGHENGDGEKSHELFKNAVEQRLLLRGSRDFAAEPEHRQFLKALRQKRNLPRQGKLEEELARMQPLPAHRTQTFREISVVVRSTSVRRDEVVVAGVVPAAAAGGADVAGGVGEAVVDDREDYAVGRQTGGTRESVSSLAS